jgi:myo-inositol-1(or 4)-monophosphatase
VREGTIIAGVIYNPANDELYIAERGKGAFLNDQRLRVAGRRQLNECVVACGLPHIGRGDHEEFRREMTAIQDRVAGLRRFGAASLDLGLRRRRPPRRLLGAQPAILGHRRRHDHGARGRAAR